MEYIANAFVGLTGQEISSFELPWEGEVPADIHLEGPAVETDHIRFVKESRGHAPGDVESVELKDGKLIVTVEPSTNKAPWTLVAGDRKFEQAEFTVKTRTADDKFAKIEEGRVMYRLYSPDATEPRPMILFLHGGGNGGYEGERDNEKQLMADYGPVNFAEDYPDVFVMAPM